MTVSQVLLISIGNTRTRLGFAKATMAGSPMAPVAKFSPASLEPLEVVDNHVEGAIAAAVQRGVQSLKKSGRKTALLLASVNPSASAEVAKAIAAMAPASPDAPELGHYQLVSDRSAPTIGRFERLVVPLPAEVATSTLGVDRLLAALAVYAGAGQHHARAQANIDRPKGAPAADAPGFSMGSGPACVVSCGTCVTVDLVSRQGFFQGGVIAPGLGMMLRAMHAGTAALPELSVPRSLDDLKTILPDLAKPIGTNTQQAMLLGAMESIRGLVHRQLDRYAEFIGHYPRLVATGGDAPLLFADDELVEHVIVDLPLFGMLATWAVTHGGEELVPLVDDEDLDGDEDEASEDDYWKPDSER
jgi:pantothenate kinase type III